MFFFLAKGDMETQVNRAVALNNLFQSPSLQIHVPVMHVEWK